MQNEEQNIFIVNVINYNSFSCLDKGSHKKSYIFLVAGLVSGGGDKGPATKKKITSLPRKIFKTLRK